MAESSSLKVFKEQLDMTFRTLFWLTRWGLIKSWNSGILEVFSSLNDSLDLRREGEI